MLVDWRESIGEKQGQPDTIPDIGILSSPKLGVGLGQTMKEEKGDLLLHDCELDMTEAQFLDVLAIYHLNDCRSDCARIRLRALPCLKNSI